MKTSLQQTQQLIRLHIWLLILGLAISGLTAFPLVSETQFLLGFADHWPVELRQWLKTIHIAIKNTNRDYPYLSYGTDWLAFAHLMLAILFVGPLRDPVKNKWIIEFGLICCLSIVPLALIAGYIREIPFFWRLVDCSFGLFAMIPLVIALRNIIKLEKIKTNEI